MINIRNLTVNTGSGNPGAIGIQYITNNQGTLADVLVKSDDEAGWAGIDMAKSNAAGPAFVNRVEVRGFDYGIDVSFHEYTMVFEHLTLSNQRVAGLRNYQNTLVIRKLTSTNTKPAVRNVHNFGTITLIDSELKGGSATESAIVNVAGEVFVRNTTTNGYGQAIADGPTQRIAGGYVAEYVSRPVRQLPSSYPTQLRSLNLPVKETPTVPQDNPADWVNVRDYGATQGDGSDDTQAIRNAIAAATATGKTTLYFPNTAPLGQRRGRYHMYRINGTIVVGGSIRRIVGMNSGLEAGGALATGAKPMFQVVDGTHPTVVIEQFFARQGPIEFVFVEKATTRTVVVRQYMGWGGRVFRSNAGGETFLEDVGTQRLRPDSDLGGNPGFEFNAGRIWARQINLEIFPTGVVNNGAVLWVLGLKMEYGEVVVETRNGGFTEMLGGWRHQGTGPAFINDNSHISVRFTNSYALQDELVRERIGPGPWQTLLSSATNNWVNGGHKGWNLPLYVSYNAAIMAAENPSPAVTPEGSLWPNPAQNEATLRMNNPTGTAREATIRITSSLGQVVAVYTRLLPAGTKHLTLDTRALADGLYVVSLRSGAYQQRHKLLVAH